MTTRIGTIVGWICAILVAAFNLFAAVMKFIPVAPDSAGALFMAKLGVTAGLEHVLGVLEFAIVILFLIPRTSTVGFVLMVGYFGGALATSLTHGLSNMDAMPVYVLFALLTISATFRNAELLTRLLKKA